MLPHQALFNWSGGKDSALALYTLLQSNEYEIQTLLTSVNEAYDRISMHGVRSSLLDAQAASIGLPLKKMLIPEMPTMEDYERVMYTTLREWVDKGVTHSIFGDIFLTDLRRYREQQLAKLDLEGVFPLWEQPTDKLIREFLDLGFKTIVTCVNDKYLDESFAGRVIDEDFLKDLPANVDPCGENGEFHTFVFDGPIFKFPVHFEIGEKVHRKYEPAKASENASYDCKKDEENPFVNGFWYCDLAEVV